MPTPTMVGLFFTQYPNPIKISQEVSKHTYPGKKYPAVFESRFPTEPENY